MILASIQEKIKATGTPLGRGEVYIVLIILFVGCVSFGLGRLSKMVDAQPRVSITEAFPVVETNIGSSGSQQQGSVLPVVEVQGQFVASRNGTKYHYPWCPGAQQMNEENKIWFATRADAEAAGYTPAANCKGL